MEKNVWPRKIRRSDLESTSGNMNDQINRENRRKENYFEKLKIDKTSFVYDLNRNHAQKFNKTF